MFRGSVVALMVTSAVAAARPVRLDVTVDACPDLAAKVRDVSTFDPSATASVDINERAGVATILLSDGHGTAFGPRIVEAASCDALATAVYLVDADGSLDQVRIGNDESSRPTRSLEIT